MLDHDTDSYQKIARAFLDGQPSGNLTRDHILDNITLYWLTGTGASAPAAYWENATPARRRPAARRRCASRSAFTRLPRRDLPGPAQLGRECLPNLIYFNEADRGGHFAAWEEPQLFAEEMRAAFRSIRAGRSS